jgi:hypothetical protein
MLFLISDKKKKSVQSSHHITEPVTSIGNPESARRGRKKENFNGKLMLKEFPYSWE